MLKTLSLFQARGDEQDFMIAMMSVNDQYSEPDFTMGKNDYHIA